MNKAEMSEAESMAAEKIAAEGAAVTGWTQGLLSRMGGGLKKSGAKLQDAASAPADSPAQIERAEASLDRAGERIGLFAASFSRQVRRSAALVREEAEDILAEAQSLRQKEQA